MTQYVPDPRFIELLARPGGRLLGQELVGVRSQHNTIRYTIWPGSLGMKLLLCEMPDNVKRGDKFKLGDIQVTPTLHHQLIKHIGDDLMIAKSDKSFMDQAADAHWIMTDGCLFDLKRERWLTW